MNINLFWLVPVASLIALGFAWFFFRQMKRKDEGTERMRQIASYVRVGAMSYLVQQYKVVTKIFVVLALIFATMAVFNLQNHWVPVAFLTGG
ncbi:MAG: sodium/proton-translocating pyrophosphatase, partial [Bacteroidales bacterium]|nr:sodium/proton-translocating pyrophosphatase [Bacteroidales bacterium]